MTDSLPPDMPDSAPPFVPVTPPMEPPRRAPIEDLTLAEALRWLVIRPRQTSAGLWRVLTRDPGGQGTAAPADEQPSGDGWAAAGTALEDEAPYEARVAPAAMAAVTTDGIAVEAVAMPPARLAWVRAAATALAVLLAVQGGRVLHAAALHPAKKLARDTDGAEVWFVLAGLVYGGVELWAHRADWAARVPWLHARLRPASSPTEGAPLWSWALLGGALVLLLVGLFGGSVWWLSGLLIALAAGLSTLAMIASTAHGPQLTRPGAMASPSPSVITDDLEFTDEPLVVRSRVRVVVPEAEAVSLWQVWAQARAGQLALIPLALLLSVLTYALNVERDTAGRALDVVITAPGALAWLVSVMLWVLVLGGGAAGVRAGLARWRATWANAPRWREWLDWPRIALLGAIAAGAVFRLYDLASTPPEMTSDHIEKLLDALRVGEGYFGVFFPNNGGREAFQMYVVAFIADVLNVGFSFQALKLATVIEGLITLPALWWMARQVIGTDTPAHRQLGSWVGAALVALVAVSSWHVMLSRLGLRIVLTPLTTALVIGALARAMRHGRMRDFLVLGGVLGGGMYFYQANRMLPILAVLGVILAVLARLRTARAAGMALVQGLALLIVALLLPLALWIVSGGSGAALALGALAWWALVALAARTWLDQPALYYAGGLLAAAIIALALYLPLHRYSALHPDEFWNRTRGRLFGEDAFQRVDVTSGEWIRYEPDTREQAERFWDQRDVFRDNYADALRMYHWEGDGAWINNAGMRPAMGAVAGGLVFLGLAIGLARGPGRRNAAWWLLPISIVIMLLPSALTLAYTVENPSFTRASGTLPAVFMLAALPLGVLAWRLDRLPLRAERVPWGALAGLAVIALAAWGSVGWQWENYFTDYRLSYSSSWKPYREIARPLRAFAEGEGSYGNAFMVAYPHWLDHRILGTMAGDIHWPNGLVTRDDLLPQMQLNRGTRYAYDPTEPLFVMFHPDDADTAGALQTLLPNGDLLLYEYSYETPRGMATGEFYTYVAPAGALEERPD